MRYLIAAVLLALGCVADNTDEAPTPHSIAAPRAVPLAVDAAVDFSTPPDLLVPDLVPPPGTIGARCERDDDCGVRVWYYDGGFLSWKMVCLTTGLDGSKQCCTKETNNCAP